MMINNKNRKVFISILGTGLYGKCKYTFGDFESSETCFIQQATLEYLGAKEWTENDVAYIFLTEKAKKDNWDASITSRKIFSTGKDQEYKGLEKVLRDEMQLPCKIETPTISQGGNEEDIWSVFDVIYKQLEEGDEVYIDLTHSFRYIPMLVLVLVNYASLLKNIEIKGITYGNYEGRDKTNNRAPIVDLMPLHAVQKWSFASANFLENGSVTDLKELVESNLKPILKDKEKRDKNPSVIEWRKFIKNISNLIQELKTCRGKDIYYANSIKNIMQPKDKMQHAIIPVMAPILDKIHDSFSFQIPEEGFSYETSKEKSYDFPTNNVINGFHAAKWCSKNKLYQQALTILQENVITYFCEKYHLDVVLDRAIVTSAFKIRNEKLLEKDWDYYYKKEDSQEVKEHKKNMVREIINDESCSEDFVKRFVNISDLRNDFNHAGMRDNPTSKGKIENMIKEYIDGTFKDLDIDAN